MRCLKIRLYVFVITHNQGMELKEKKNTFILFKLYDYNLEFNVLLGQT